MTDIVITAANVVPGDGAVVYSGTAGATITQGQALYKEAASGTYKLADSNAATAEARTPVGIALNAASAGQPISFQKSGPITIGGTLTPGVAYYLSAANAGGICAVADLTTGDYPALLGMAASASVLNLAIQAPGVSL